MRTAIGRCIAVVMLAGLVPAGAAGQPAVGTIRAIQIVSEGPVTRVTIEADGPLPLPLSDSLTDPPRIYFDLAGVSHKVGETTVAPRGGIVSRVRVALRQAAPRVTRVVLDLTKLEGYSVNIDDRQAGRISILVGSEAAIHPEPPRAAVSPKPAPVPPLPPPANSSAPIPPARVAALPPPPMLAGNASPATADTSKPIPPPARPPVKPLTPPGRNPVLSPEPPRPALPAMDVAIYRKQIYGELGRIEALRLILVRVDAGESVNAEILKLAVQEFTEIRRLLEDVKPAQTVSVAHDLLMTACTLGSMASSQGIEAVQSSKLEARERAASTAAGALMLIDRACADLGCGKTPR